MLYLFCVIGFTLLHCGCAADDEVVVLQSEVRSRVGPPLRTPKPCGAACNSFDMGGVACEAEETAPEMFSPTPLAFEKTSQPHSVFGIPSTKLLVSLSMKQLFYFLLIGALKWLLKWMQGPRDDTWTRKAVVKDAMMKFNYSDVSSDVGSALFQAVQMGDVSQCDKLAKSGVSLSKEDEWGCTPLHIASKCGLIDVVKWLLAHDVLVDATDAADETPLHLAARGGHVDVSEQLFAHGASIHMQNVHNQCPLSVAALAGQESMCRFLRSRGAAVDHVEHIPLKFQPWLVEKVYVPSAEEHDSSG